MEGYLLRFVTLLLIQTYFVANVVAQRMAEKDTLIELKEANIKAFPSFKEQSLGRNASISLKNTALFQDQAFNTAAALNRLPGVYMQQGALTTSRISLRGIGAREPFGSSKIKAYFNDIPLTTVGGITSINAIDPLFMQTVTVFRGTNSSLFGAGLGGTLLFENQLDSMAPTLFLNQSVGSYNSFHTQAKLNLAWDKQQITLGFARLTQEGFRENSNYERNQLFYRHGFLFSKEQELSFTVLFTDKFGEIPSSITEKDFETNPQKAAANWLAANGYESSNALLAGITYQDKFSESWELKTTQFIRVNQLDELRPFNTLTEDYYSVGTRSLISYQKQNLQFTSGIELQVDERDYVWTANEYSASNPANIGQQLYNAVEEGLYTNIFSEFFYSLSNKWVVQGGVNFNRTAYQYSDSIQNNALLDFGNDISPRIGVSYYPSTNQAISLQVSKGFSTPTFEESLNNQQVFSTNLNPETGITAELGYLLSTRNIQLQGQLFYTSIDNQITVRRISETIFTGLNAGSATHYGAEVFLNSTLINSPSKKVDLQFSATLLQARFNSFIESGNDYSGNRIPGVPQALANLVLNAGLRETWQFQVNAFYRSPMYLADDNLHQTDEAINLRFRLQRNFEFSFAHISLYAGADNLLNKNMADMILINAIGFGQNAPRYYYPSNPRFWYTGIQIKI